MDWVDEDDELFERLGQKFGSWTEEDPEGEEIEDEGE